MKVLMTADTVGGVWTYCMDLCRALQHYNVELHLVTMGDRMKDWQRQEVKAVENVAVYETAFQLEWMQNPWQDIKECGDYLLQLENEIRPHLIHLNCFAYGSLPFSAPVLVVAHSDVWSWFEAVKGERPPAEWNDYFQCVQKGLRGADKVVAPSGAMLQYIKRIYDIPDGYVIYNGRDANLFHADQKQPAVFSMGRIWDEAKNTKLLIDAAALINAPVRIAGDNSFDRNSIEATNIGVAFLGKLSTQQIAAELAKASVYVLPAKYEPFGLSALEAALSGCALVLGDIPSLREIWKDTAVYVGPNDAGKLTQTVNALLQDNNLLNEWCRKAQARAKWFSIESAAQQYWQLYQQLHKQAVHRKTLETV